MYFLLCLLLALKTTLYILGSEFKFKGMFISMKITSTCLDSFFNIPLFQWQSGKKLIYYKRKSLLYQFFLDTCLQVHLHRNIHFWITYKNYCKGLLFRRLYFSSGPMELAWFHCHYICVSAFFETVRYNAIWLSMSASVFKD